MSVCNKDYPPRLQTLLVFFIFNFEWHGQNEVGNIAILVLWRDREQLYWLRSIQHKEDLTNVILYLQLTVDNSKVAIYLRLQWNMNKFVEVGMCYPMSFLCFIDSS